MPSISPINVTPATFLKNEEYWVHYVLRDLLKVFGRAVMLDTGSTDATVRIAQETAKALNGSLYVMQENYGTNRNAIGNAPNVLRKTVSTEWMLLVGGDEIWTEDQLLKLLKHGLPSGKNIGMVTGRNITAAGGKLLERDRFSADRLFDRSVKWHKVDYPFEGHGLQNKLDRVHYIPVSFWHMRHLQRSSEDELVYFRRDKSGYFPWDGKLKKLPENWLGEVAKKYPNPYKGVIR